MLNTLLPILLFAALGLAVLGALRRVAMWRQGRASKVDLIGGLFAMPKRYMVDLHHVVARDKYIANTHVATAGGAVASIVLAILVHGFGLHNRILGYALLLMSAVMFVGAIFMFLRRRNPPARLSKGPWMRLPKKPDGVLGVVLPADPAGCRHPSGKTSVVGWWLRSSASVCCGALANCSSA